MTIAIQILMGLAGLAYCLATVLRWRGLRGSIGPTPSGWIWPVWAGLGVHSIALVLALIDRDDRALSYGVLGSWSAIASLVFLARFLALPSRGLLLLPVGAMVLLVVGANLTGRRPDAADEGGISAIALLHILFMSTHLGAMLVAGTSGALHRFTRRELKQEAAVALKLPNLPVLARVTQRSLVTATALLLGGLATGGLAVAESATFSLWHPTPILGLVAMVLLIGVLGLDLSGRLRQRQVAGAAIMIALVTAGAVMSLMMSSPHGR